MFQHTAEFYHPGNSKPNHRFRSLFSEDFNPLSHIKEAMAKQQTPTSETNTKHKEKTPPNSPPKSENFNWQPYVSRFMKEKYKDSNSWYELIYHNFKHMIRELIVVETTTQYGWNVICRNQELEEFGDGNKESFEVFLSALVKKIMAELGTQAATGEKQSQHPPVDLSRAFMEQFIFSPAINSHLEKVARAKAFSDSHPPESCVLVCSPPDKAPLYFGSDSIDDPNNPAAPETHQTFFFVFRVGALNIEEDPVTKQKVLKSFRVEATQLRTWHNFHDLQRLYQDLGFPIDSDPAVPLPTKIMARVLEWQDAPGTPAADIEAAISQLLYHHPDQDQQKWSRRPEQTPVLPDNDAFWKEYESLFNQFFMPNLNALMQKLQQLQDKKKHTAQTAQEIEQIEAQLTELFKMTFSSLQKRVRVLNTNPQYEQLAQEEEARQPWFAKLDRAVGKVIRGFQQRVLRQDIKAQEELPLSNPQKQADIAKAFRIHQQYIRKEFISLSDSLWYLNNVNQLFQLGGFVFGSGQCFSVEMMQNLLFGFSGQFVEVYGMKVPAGERWTYEPNRVCPGLGGQPCRAVPGSMEGHLFGPCGICRACDPRLNPVPAPSTELPWGTTLRAVQNRSAGESVSRISEGSVSGEKAQFTRADGMKATTSLGEWVAGHRASAA